MPRRCLQKGRQVSGATTRMASQALRLPRLNGGLASPRQSQVDQAAAHHPEGLPDGVVGRGTGRGDGVGRAGEAIFHGDMAGRSVGHHPWNGKGVRTRPDWGHRDRGTQRLACPDHQYPDPVTTPVRCFNAGVQATPPSAMASRAAISPNWAKRSINSRCFLSKWSSS